MINLTNLQEKVIEETSLEGLDGTTLNTLSLRLQERLFIEQNPSQLDKNKSAEIKSKLQTIFEKEVLLDLILNQLIGKAISDGSIGFYKLSKSRKEPVIFNRFETFSTQQREGKDQGQKDEEQNQNQEVDDERIGTSIGKAPDENPSPDGKCKITQNLPIEVIYGERGSNSDKKRIKIKKENLSLDFIKNIKDYKNTVTIVASLDYRLQILANNDPNAYSAIKSLADMEYIILEYVARCRYQGCIQAYIDKYIFTNINSHINFLMKKLVRAKLVTKQNYAYFTSARTSTGSSSNNTMLSSSKEAHLLGRERPINQILILHKNFHRVVRNKQDTIASKLLNYVKKQPYNRINMQELRDVSKLKPNTFKKNYEYMIKIEVIECNSLRKDNKRPISLKQRDILFVKDLPDSTIEDRDQGEENSWKEDEHNNLSMVNYIRSFRNVFIHPKNGTGYCFITKSGRLYDEAVKENLTDRKISKYVFPHLSTSLVEYTARILLSLNKYNRGYHISITDMQNIYDIGRQESRHLLEKILEKKADIIAKLKVERVKTREHKYYIKPKIADKISIWCKIDDYNFDKFKPAVLPPLIDFRVVWSESRVYRDLQSV